MSRGSGARGKAISLRDRDGYVVVVSGPTRTAIRTFGQDAAPGAEVHVENTLRLAIRKDDGSTHHDEH